LDDSMRMTYDRNGNALTMTDYRGNTTTQEFNGANFMTKKTEPNNKVTNYTVDGLGHVLSETTTGVGGSRTTEREYLDPSYQVTKEVRKATSAGDLIVRTNYDENGNKLSVIDARGNTMGMSYDNFDRVLALAEPLGKTTTSVRDPNGNVTFESVTRGGSFEPKTNTKTYDKLNRVITATDATGAITTMVYDGVGNVLSSSNSRGATIVSAYDERNRKLTDIGPLPGIFTRYAYDLVGNVLTETHGNGQVISYVYDKLNRRTRVTDGLGFVSEQSFDENGNLISSTDAKGRISLFTYNALNQKIFASLPASEP
jgi:YD repeat-containing protein